MEHFAIKTIKHVIWHVVMHFFLKVININPFLIFVKWDLGLKHYSLLKGYRKCIYMRTEKYSLESLCKVELHVGPKRKIIKQPQHQNHSTLIISIKHHYVKSRVEKINIKLVNGYLKAINWFCLMVVILILI